MPDLLIMMVQFILNVTLRKTDMAPYALISLLHFTNNLHIIYSVEIGFSVDDDSLCHDDTIVFINKKNVEQMVPSDVKRCIRTLKSSNQVINSVLMKKKRYRNYREKHFHRWENYSIAC